MSKPNRAERIINFLEARYPGWVPAIELEPVGGRQAWRTAVSEGRQIVKERGDDIENRTRTFRVNGEPWILSEYRLKKRGESSQTEEGVKGSEHGDRREVRTDEASHDLNEWELR